ncbi:hypothetical protein PIB30_112663, partial [Stylosanthes scabra]|nr:hypothetical protein [Stylosanthes scabra]
ERCGAGISQCFGTSDQFCAALVTPGVTTARHSASLLAVVLEALELVLAVDLRELPQIFSSYSSIECPNHPNPHREYTVLLGVCGTSHHQAVGGYDCYVQSS